MYLFKGVLLTRYSSSTKCPVYWRDVLLYLFPHATNLYFLSSLYPSFKTKTRNYLKLRRNTCIINIFVKKTNKQISFLSKQMPSPTCLPESNTGLSGHLHQSQRLAKHHSSAGGKPLWRRIFDFSASNVTISRERRLLNDQLSPKPLKFRDLST